MKPSSADTIHYLPHNEINKEKWDACLQASDNPLIYASSAYLDGMCRHWDGLVMNDYDAIMPLPWNRKWGIAYVYSPYFVVAGGVFGNTLSEDVILQFIRAIPPTFRYVDFDLNEQNFFSDQVLIKNMSFRKRRNTFLDLRIEYKTVFSQYNSLAQRKIKKAAKYKLQLDRAHNVNGVVNLYRRYYEGKDVVVEKFDFTNMVAFLQHQFARRTRTYVLSFPNGEVCAFYLLLYDEKYVYWLLGGSTEAGKEAGAFYYLTDQVIQDFAGTNRTFRFEGSDHEGIHFFNRQFGGTTVYYPRIVMNRLPWAVALNEINSTIAKMI